MNQHDPALIIIIPLLSAFLITAVGWLRKEYCFHVAFAALGLSLFSSVRLLLRVLDNGGVQYRLGGWPPPWGIAYQVDHLNGFLLVVAAAVAFANLVATRISVAEEFSEKIGSFYTLYVLFVTGNLGIVITGDAFNLYVLLEIASLTGYALIGMGKGEAPLASLNYVFMGTVGASFYLLGIGYIYLVTGSLNMQDIASLMPDLFSSAVIFFAFAICMVGLFIKMALFPLHIWLPDAYALSPSPAASLVAPLTTKVMVYVMIRMLFSVFTPSFSFASPAFNHLMVWLATAGILIASLAALCQRTLIRMLAYIIVAEIGYMAGGVWLGNRLGLIGAILHIANDALMTLCLFLAAGTFLYRLREDAFDRFAGLLRKMPLSMAAFVVGGLSIIGVPPTCGFFSKWYLILGGLSAGHYGFVFALLFSSLIHVILFFRIIEIGFFEPFVHNPEGSHGSGEAEISEAPAWMLIPLMVVAASLIAIGLWTDKIVSEIIQPGIPVTVT